MEIDPSTPFGARLLARLAGEQIIWLTTVGGDGAPQPSPVWFIWDGDSLLIYSRPGAPKLRNIAARPRVALNFNTAADGDDVAVLAGEAQLDAGAPPAGAHAAYLAKYADGIARLGSDPERFSAAYSAAIRVTLSRARGW